MRNLEKKKKKRFSNLLTRSFPLSFARAQHGGTPVISPRLHVTPASHGGGVHGGGRVAQPHAAPAPTPSSSQGVGARPAPFLPSPPPLPRRLGWKRRPACPHPAPGGAGGCGRGGVARAGEEERRRKGERERHGGRNPPPLPCSHFCRPSWSPLLAVLPPLRSTATFSLNSWASLSVTCACWTPR